MEGAAGSDISVCTTTLDTSAGTRVGSNNEIVEKLLNYLEKKDLLKCRLVSKVWNDEVVRFLTKMPKSYSKNVFVGNMTPFATGPTWCTPTLVCSSTILTIDIFQLANTETGNKTLRNFHLLLEKSKHPEFMFKVIKISQKKVDKFNASPMNILECGQILQKFGHHVKSLEIKDDEEFSALSRCLGQTGYCPNLSELKLTISVRCNNDLPYFIQPFVRNMGSLKLKKLKFEYSKEAVSTYRSITSVLNVFDVILEQSPGIEELIITPDRHLMEPSDKTKTHAHRFISVLQTKPHTTNLKKFHLKGTGILDNFHALSFIQFGSLKKLYLFEKKDATGGLEKTTEERRGELGKFLKSVANSLESFDLYFIQKSTGVTLREIPLMSKLKNLNLSVDSNEDEVNFQFLKNLPALRKLGVHLPEPMDRDHFYSLLESSVSSRFPVVHERLENFDWGLGIFSVTSPKMIENLNIAFPNLTRLLINPSPPRGSSVQEIQSIFEQCFHFLSKMKRLKTCYISFGPWEYALESNVDFTPAFSNLKKTPNLEELVLYVLYDDDFKVNLVADSLPALLGTPKLRIVKFSLFRSEKMKDIGLKRKLLQLKVRFAESKVELELQWG